MTKLAQPIAEEARKKAVAEVTTTIDKYGKALRRYNDAKTLKKNKDLTPPADLDLAPLAAKYNFPVSETKLVDRFEIAKYEIGEKVQQLDMQTLHRARDRLVGERTALINQLRAVLLERGILVPQGKRKFETVSGCDDGRA